MQSTPETRIPKEISQVQYKDLSGLVKRQDSSIYSEHSGGYADVFIGYLTKGANVGSKVAIKVLRLDNDKDNTDRIKTYLVRETVVWQELHHHNILNFLGLASEYGKYNCPALISPYCDNGTVNDYLKTHPDPAMRLFMIKGVSDGLLYLHGMNVVHGDLKPSNILVHDDGHPLLCDFGRSKILTQRGFTTKPAGAFRYQAPEYLKGETGANEAVDVYAFALTSYEIWTGLQPFRNSNGTTIIINIVTRDARPDYPDSAPLGTDVLWKLFQDCWRTKPEERLGTAAVKQRLADINIPCQ